MNTSPKPPALDDITKPNLTTREAAYYLNRAPQTLRAAYCYGRPPVKVLRINGRLAWPVSEIKRLVLGVKP